MQREALELRSSLSAPELRARMLRESARPWRVELSSEAVLGLALAGRVVIWRSSPGLLLRLLPRPALWCRCADRDGVTVVSAVWGLPPEPLLGLQLLACAAFFVALFGVYGLLGSLLMLLATWGLVVLVTSQLLDEDGEWLERWLMHRVSPFGS